jgi:hypothetical protein
MLCCLKQKKTCNGQVHHADKPCCYQTILGSTCHQFLPFGSTFYVCIAGLNI